MDGFFTALASEVTVANLLSSLTPAAAIVGVAIAVSFVYMVTRKAVGGLGRGKARV